MPKGVEHSTHAARPSSRQAPVQESLMPKGVEHRVSNVGIFPRLRVQESLMPKGVEHNTAKAGMPHGGKMCRNR